MWQIHSWNKRTQTGFVRSPHFGPRPFGAEANPCGTTDFVAGEEVVVALAGDPSDYRVESVREVRPKPQPPGTHCADFDVLSGLSDFHTASAPDEPLVLWFGNHCGYCDPGAHVSFSGVVSSWTEEDEEDHDFYAPLLRLASQEEVERHKVQVPPGTVAYCIVDQPYRPWDEVCDPLFVVAKSVSVEVIPRRA